MVSIDARLGAIKRDPAELLDRQRVMELCRERTGSQRERTGRERTGSGRERGHKPFMPGNGKRGK
jgi:hypothetical protein